MPPARAVEAAEKTHDTASLLEGIKLVLQQLGTVLQRHHCTPIKALGEPFDPNFHDAILHQPAPDVPANWLVMRAPGGFLQTQDHSDQAMAWTYASKLYNAESNVRWNFSDRIALLAGIRWINFSESLVGRTYD